MQGEYRRTVDYIGAIAAAAAICYLNGYLTSMHASLPAALSTLYSAQFGS